jgi:hypothetical protein
MHTVDGGILRRAVAYLFVVGKNIVPEHINTRYPNDMYNATTGWLKKWSTCIPSEFSRRPRSIDEIDKWKMRETNMTATMILPAFTCVDEVWDTIDHAHFYSFLKLVVYCRLIGGYSIKPVRSDDVELAERLVVEYIEFIKRNGRADTVPYVSHSAAHLPKESRMYNMQLGNVSAYPFENFMKYFRPVSVNRTTSKLSPFCMRSMPFCNVHSLLSSTCRCSATRCTL